MSSNEKVKTNGKVPLEKKSTNVGEFYTGAPKSVLEVPEICLSELKTKGLVCRWIDIVELKKNYNFHRQGWKPYKFECLSNNNKSAGPFAETGMDGFMVRANAVLAVKTEAEAIVQKSHIQRKTKMQSNAVGQAEEQFRKFASQEKSIKVHNWDKNDEES